MVRTPTAYASLRVRSLSLTNRQRPWVYAVLMNVTPPNPDYLVRTPNQEPAPTLTQRWSVLLEKVGQIAQMAELSPEPADGMNTEMNTRFANALARTGALFGNHTHTAAQRAVEDMEILVEMGLTALKEVEARGQDPGAPALALWREVYHAREAVLSVMEPVAA